MALAKRLIPCLDVDKGRVVKGIHFVNLRDAGDPAELGRRYCDEGADELVFLDITASPERRRILRKLVADVAEVLDIPFTVGGGIRTLSDARLVLCNGADKVSINTAAVRRPNLVRTLSERFGQQCIVVAVDAKRRYDDLQDKTVVVEDGKKMWFEVYIEGARIPTGLDALRWVKRVEELGAGEILLTSIDRDGTQIGYDITLTRAVSERINIPVIASGGCGSLEHILEVFQQGRADAALAASIFHYSKYSILEVKKFLSDRGVIVRI